MTAEKAGRWLRVSTKAQDEANQEPDIDQWIADHGYDPAETYVLRGKSAYKGKQDAMLDRVIADMDAGRIRVLVVWQSSRIERRGAYNAFDLARRVRDAGGRIEYVKDQYLNEANDMSDVMLALAATKDREESRDKSKRVLAVHSRIRSGGGMIGRPAFGWDSVGEKYGKRHVINEAEAAVTREMCSRYLAGESLGQICDDFAERGITAKYGAAWTTKSMAQYLHRPTLYGTRHSDEYADQDVPPIIGYATWKRIQERMAGRSRKTGGRVPAGPSLLAGVLHCGACRNRMYLTNAGYYCRKCPKGRRLLINRDAAELAVISYLELEWDHMDEEITERPVDDRQHQIDRLSADIQRMNPAATENYLAVVTEKLAAIDEIKADLRLRPGLAPVTRKTGRSVGQAFASASEAEQKAILKRMPLAVCERSPGDYEIRLLNPE